MFKYNVFAMVNQLDNPVNSYLQYFNTNIFFQLSLFNLFWKKTSENLKNNKKSIRYSLLYRMTFSHLITLSIGISSSFQSSSSSCCDYIFINNIIKVKINKDRSILYHPAFYLFIFTIFYLVLISYIRKELRVVILFILVLGSVYSKSPSVWQEKWNKIFFSFFIRFYFFCILTYIILLFFNSKQSIQFQLRYIRI